MSIYQNFCIESFDEHGNLKKFDLRYPDNFNFGYDVVDAIAASTPEKQALVWCNAEGEERIFTFDEISRLSNRAANAMHAAGVTKGDRVLLLLKRHFEYWICAVALHKLGAVMIPATHLLTADDLCYRIKSADIRHIICTPHNGVPDKIGIALRQAEKTACVWTVNKPVEGFRFLNCELENASETFDRIDTLATDPMVIYFTSGTTGYPKGVIHDFSYPLAHIVTAKYWQQAEEGGLHFTVAETGWAKASWGKIYGQWLVGCAVMAYDFDTFDPRRLVEVINRYGVTSFCAPPTVYRYLVRKEIPPMPTLRHASTAGETLAPEVFDKFHQMTGISLAEGYGQTETTLLLANFSREKSISGALGVPSPQYQIEIHSRSGKPVEIGEVGEIVIIPQSEGKLTGVFTGYLGGENPGRNAWRNGAYHTGDTAWQDENGVFWFHGRFDDIIKTGGYRVGPYEVENILQRHPAVAECCVVGIPDAARGQAIKAVIHLSRGYEPIRQTEKEIREFCNSQLAEYKWIRQIEFVDSMPKTISGKIRKIEFR